jgi:hypothetical protein
VPSRISKLGISLLPVLALLLFSTPVRGQSLPDRKEASEWVRNALEASDLKSPDAAPYHLVAKLHYVLGDKTLDGTYEILWAAPDRWRVEIRMGDTGETLLFLEDKEYVVRNTPTMTVPMASISMFLFRFDVFAPPPKAQSDAAVYKLYFTGKGATRQICALVGDHKLLENEFCFNTNSELVSRHERPEPYGPVLRGTYSLDMVDYVRLGNIRYPQHLSRRVGPESIDATVQKWETVKQFDANVFSPPPNSTVWDWCSTPEIQMPQNTRQQSLSAALDQSVAGTGHPPYLAVYQIVGTDGIAKQNTELFSSPESLMKEFMSQQSHERWPIPVCNGKPVQYEHIFMYWALLPKLR